MDKKDLRQPSHLEIGLKQNPFIGDDCQDYLTAESLKDANRRWRESRFIKEPRKEVLDKLVRPTVNIDNPYKKIFYPWTNKTP